MDISDYGLFYSTIFEGFDTCDDSDDDEEIDGEGINSEGIDDEEDTNSLDNFIVDDNDNYSSDGDYELDEDITEY